MIGKLNGLWPLENECSTVQISMLHMSKKTGWTESSDAFWLNNAISEGLWSCLGKNSPFTFQVTSSPLVESRVTPRTIYLNSFQKCAFSFISVLTWVPLSAKSRMSP